MKIQDPPITGSLLLVVEDEALIAEEIQDRLQRLYYRVLGHVDNANDAIAAAREWRPDLVLMDIRLKGNRDGISAAEEIAQMNIPVVYLTAHSDMDTLRRAKASSPFGYVLKPFHERDLFVAIEMAMQRHSTERRLRESEARYSTTLASIGDGVIATDPAGQVTFMNPVAESLTGWPLSEAKGLEIERILPLVDEQSRRNQPNPVKLALERGDTVRCDERILLIGRGGETVPFEDCAAPIRDDSGRLSGAVVAFRDASPRRQAEQALEVAKDRLHRAEKLEAVGRLAGFVAHDFNNLITIVQVNAELMALERALPPEQAEHLRTIQAACGRAASLTGRLLAYSRRQVMVPFVVDMNTIVSGLRELLERMLGEDVELVIQLSSAPLPVRVDPGQIEHVILNLAVNARDAMRDGGTLRIETGACVVEPGQTLRDDEGDVPPGNYVMLQVSDTGMGMDAATRARIFEPFFSTKDARIGTGLGLASVQGIVRQSSGHISVVSEPGNGALFTLYFPARPREELQTTQGQDQRRAPAVRGHGTLLLVEDEDEVRSASRQALEHQGYTVIEARDAASALRLLEAQETPIDLLVTDVVLPGTPGTRLALELRARVPDLPVLFLSGYSEEFVHGTLPPIEGSRVLRKPYTLSELARGVNETLRRT